MLRRLMNLPFSVAGRAARAFQEREDARVREKYGATQDPGEVANSADPPRGPIVLQPVDPASIRMDAATAIAAQGTRRNVVFVDTREHPRGTTIPGALRMPLSEVSNRVSELSDDQLVIAFCEDGAASTPATQFFRERGIEDSWFLAGGLVAWRAAGGPSAGVP